MAGGRHLASMCVRRCLTAFGFSDAEFTNAELAGTAHGEARILGRMLRFVPT